MRPDGGDAAYLWDIREAAQDILSFTDGLTLSAFVANRQKLLAVERAIEIIGEAARRVSPAFQTSHPEIPWRAMIGQRNVLAHDYAEIDYEVIWKTVNEDLTPLIDRIGSLLPPDLNP